MQDADNRTLFRQRVPRRTLLRSAALGSAGLAAAALLGCGGGDDAKPVATSTTSGSPPPSASNDPRYPRDPNLPYAYNFPEPNKQPKSGGVLHVAATWDVSTEDPTKSAAGGTITVPNNVYNRIIGIKGGPNVNPFKIETVPELAKSWERTPDGLQFTFKLESGVKWQNISPLLGRAFTATDAQYAFTRYKSEGVHQSYWVNVDKIEAVDPVTLRITLKKPTPEFEVPLGSRYQTIFPRELVESGEIDKKIIGTGPMILKEAVASDHVTLVKNPDYWRHVPYLDGAEFRIMPDASARLAAFRAKQVEYGYSVVSNFRELDDLKGTVPDVQVNLPPIVSTTLPFSMNLSNPKFQDVRIRRGISTGIDRASILKLIYEGYGKQVATVMPWTFIFDNEPTDYGPWTKFDLAESKKQLAAAGAEGLTFNYVYYPYSATYDRLSEILVDQFRAAGITMKGGKTDYTTFNSQWVGGKLPEASTSGWAAVGFDANTFFYNHLFSKSPGNRWQLNDPQIDTWAEQQSVELDPAKRRELFKKIWDRDLDMAYRPPLPAGYAPEVYQGWLRGMRFGGILGSNSSYYDWGAQIENAWLDK